MRLKALIATVASCIFSFSYPALCSDNVVAVVNGEKVLERDIYSKYEKTFAEVPLEAQIFFQNTIGYSGFKELYITDILLLQEIRKLGLDNLCDTNLGNVGVHAECIASARLKKVDKEADGLSKLYREYQNYTGKKERSYLDVVVFGSNDAAIKAHKIATTNNPRILSEYGGFKNRFMSSRQEIQKKENKYIVKGPANTSPVDCEYSIDDVALAASNAKANDIVGPLQAGTCFVIFSVTDCPSVNKATYEEFAEKVMKDKQKYLAKVIENKLWLEAKIESTVFGKNYQRKFRM